LPIVSIAETATVQYLIILRYNATGGVLKALLQVAQSPVQSPLTYRPRPSSYWLPKGRKGSPLRLQRRAHKACFAIGSLTKTFTSALFANGSFTHNDWFDWDSSLKRYLTGYLETAGQDISPTMSRH
jgi:hypothetical protein